MLRYEKTHDVAQMIGHKSVRTTFNCYRYPVNEEKERGKIDMAFHCLDTEISPEQQEE